MKKWIEYMTTAEANDACTAGMQGTRTTGKAVHVLNAWRAVVSFAGTHLAFKTWRNLLASGFYIYKCTPMANQRLGNGSLPDDGGGSIALQALVQAPQSPELAQAFIDGWVVLVRVNDNEKPIPAYVDFEVQDDVVNLIARRISDNHNLSREGNITVLARDVTRGVTPADTFELPEGPYGQGK